MGGPLSLGFTAFILRLARGENPRPATILSGFENLGRAVGVNVAIALIITVVIIICVCPIILITGATLFSALAGSWTASSLERLIPIFLISILCIIVVTVVLSLILAMSFFVLCDNPSIGVFRALGTSRRIMSGNKFKFFLLTLSFIGWIALTGLICAVIEQMLSFTTSNQAAGLAADLIQSLISCLIMAPVYVYIETAVAIFYETAVGNRRQGTFEGKFSIELPPAVDNPDGAREITRWPVGEAPGTREITRETRDAGEFTRGSVGEAPGTREITRETQDAGEFKREPVGEAPGAREITGETRDAGEFMRGSVGDAPGVREITREPVGDAPEVREITREPVSETEGSPETRKWPAETPVLRDAPPSVGGEAEDGEGERF
jgi:uncharacterized membrane protein